MSAYRFCRTDDIALLVDALNYCWAPHFPEDPLMTAAAFKRSIRDLQVWCSSCMVAFSGSEPIGVLIGAKRPFATLVHRIAVHPDHLRQGHGRHVLTSLASKLAILGPPRIVAEVPEALSPASALFRACGYAHEAVLTDYVLESDSNDVCDPLEGRFVIPVSVDDLAANDLLRALNPQAGWERSVETLMARKDEIEGLAIASDERIEACILYARSAVQGVGPADAHQRPDMTRRLPAAAEIVALRSFVEDSGERLKALVTRVRAQGMDTLRFPKVHPAEMPNERLGALGFRPAGAHTLYAARAG